MHTRRHPARFGAALLLLPLLLGPVGCGGDNGGDINSPDETGSVRVSVTTSGTAPDAGYAVALDGGDEREVATSGSVTFTNVEAGTHTVELSGLPSECSVDDDSQQVEVEAGARAEVAFAVTCGGSGDETGTAVVTTRTTGENIDPDGYTLVVDGEEVTQLEVNGTVVLSEITPSGTDSYQVELGGVASNCSVTNGGTQSVRVVAGDTVEVTFEVACASDGGNGGETGTAPTVTIEKSPTVVTTQPGDTSAVTFRYSDPDADVTTFVIYVISDPSQIYGTTGDSAVIDISGVTQGKTEDVLSYSLGCADPNAPCALSGQDEVTLGIRLLDAQGNQSERADFTFDVFSGSTGTGIAGKAATRGRLSALRLPQLLRIRR